MIPLYFNHLDVSNMSRVFVTIDGVKYESPKIDMEVITQYRGVQQCFTTLDVDPSETADISIMESTRITDAHPVPDKHHLAILRLPGVHKMKDLAISRPIKNIISTVKRNVTSYLSGLQKRISWDTFYIATQEDLGCVENICRDVFPDPASRPTFRIASLSARFRYAIYDMSDTKFPIEKKPSDYKHDLEKSLHAYAADEQNGMSIILIDSNRIVIGPIVQRM